LIIGIGTDLCEISRIESAMQRFGDRFAQKVLVESELERLRSHAKPASYLAKRFAAKEALSKALGTGIRYPVTWRRMGVINLPSGRPTFRFEPDLAAYLDRRGIQRVHLSITDETGLAGAYVILEGEHG
jgi:holo-[acyl-carrier protein] synthase